MILISKRLFLKFLIFKLFKTSQLFYYFIIKLKFPKNNNSNTFNCNMSLKEEGFKSLQMELQEV